MERSLREALSAKLVLIADAYEGAEEPEDLLADNDEPSDVVMRLAEKVRDNVPLSYDDLDNIVFHLSASLLSDDT